MERIRTDLADPPAGTRSVVIAHAFVAGGLPSESERDIAVGGVSVVPLELFDGFDYTALGHLHGRATLSETVRYSGSPIAYSFSEADHVKGSWLVDLDGPRFRACLLRPGTRRSRRSRGSRAPSRNCSPTPVSPSHEDCWVQVTLTDDVRPLQAMDRLRARFPHALALRFAPRGGEQEAPRASTAGRSAHDITLDFVAHVRGAPATDSESDLLRTALECCSEDPDLVAGRDAVVSG